MYFQFGSYFARGTRDCIAQRWHLYFTTSSLGLILGISNWFATSQYWMGSINLNELFHNALFQQCAVNFATLEKIMIQTRGSRVRGKYANHCVMLPTPLQIIIYYIFFDTAGIDRQRTANRAIA